LILNNKIAPNVMDLLLVEMRGSLHGSVPVVQPGCVKLRRANPISPLTSRSCEQLAPSILDSGRAGAVAQSRTEIAAAYLTITL
jgi:hypothetical protein